MTVNTVTTYRNAIQGSFAICPGLLKNWKGAQMTEQFEEFEQNLKPKNSKAGKIIAIILAVCISPFVLLFCLFALEGISNHIATQKAAELSPRVKALMPLNEAFLKAATAPAATAAMPYFKNWTSAVSFETTLLGCPEPSANDSPDACMMSDSGPLSTESPKKLCTDVIEYAKGLGATNEMSVLFPQGTPLSEKSVDNCAATLMGQPRSAAWALFSPQYVLYGNFKPDTPMAIGLTHGQESPNVAAGGVNAPSMAPYDGKQILQPLLDIYSITVATTLDVAKIEVAANPFDGGKNRTAALLDLIAYYRTANPQQDPRSKIFIDAVIKDFNARYKFDGSWKPYVTEDKKVHWIQVVRKDGYKICIAIDRKNSTDKNINEQRIAGDSLGNADFTGNGDISWGLPGFQTVELSGVGNKISDSNADYYFGDYYEGTCS
jgi:hypothetical protein